MPTATPFRRYAGPNRAGGIFHYTSRFPIVMQQIDDATASMMRQLGQDILIWLRTNLHRWTGEMAREAFAEVFAESGEIRVRFGSDTDHTFWHEVVYHPQMRECADLFGPQIGERLQRMVAGIR